MELPDDVKDLLQRILGKELTKFSLSLHEPNKKGTGHLGEFFFVSLADEESDKRHDWAVKRNLKCESEKFQKFIDEAYVNEIYFYDTLMPAYRQLELEASAETFDKVSRFVGAEDGKILIFENLKLLGFETHEKSKPMDREHWELIFNTYGRFHALSYALRELNPEKFSEAKEKLKNSFGLSGPKTNEEFTEYMLRWMGRSPALLELIGDLLNNLQEIYFYKGPYEMIVHGDCWSNNMMFKYNKSNALTDIRLLDFQLCRSGTPVYDLSYCFYSGADKKQLGQLDYYLRLYHRSLSKSLAQFGLDPEVIYPLSALKEEWRKYCKFGFCSGVMIWKIKLASEGDALDMTKPEEEIKDDFGSDKFISEEYLMRVSDLVDHLKENGFD